jgi:hypothetical protein
VPPWLSCPGPGKQKIRDDATRICTGTASFTQSTGTASANGGLCDTLRPDNGGVSGTGYSLRQQHVAAFSTGSSLGHSTLAHVSPSQHPATLCTPPKGVLFQINAVSFMYFTVIRVNRNRAACQALVHFTRNMSALLTCFVPCVKLCQSTWSD